MLGLRTTHPVMRSRCDGQRAPGADRVRFMMQSSAGDTRIFPAVSTPEIEVALTFGLASSAAMRQTITSRAVARIVAQRLERAARRTLLLFFAGQHSSPIESNENGTPRPVPLSATCRLYSPRAPDPSVWRISSHSNLNARTLNRLRAPGAVISCESTLRFDHFTASPSDANRTISARVAPSSSAGYSSSVIKYGDVAPTSGEPSSS